MKERPILFSGDMVRAILEGRKTQTRRVVKPQPYTWAGWDYCYKGLETSDYQGFVDEMSVLCPYGKVGDRLWVRETWSVGHGYDGCKPSEIPPFPFLKTHYAATEDRGGLLWRPSIFMPRWASRILLEVTDVRVERVQEISEDDARAEGVYHPKGIEGIHRVAFQEKWDSINAKRGHTWESNPYVWVITFKRIGEQV